jgi:hypothetical protein
VSAPELSCREREVLRRFDLASPAPESFPRAFLVELSKTETVTVTVYAVDHDGAMAVAERELRGWEAQWAREADQ